MIARRLLIVMLILVGISTIVPVLLPPPAAREDTSTTTTDTAAAPPGGSLVRRTIDANRARAYTVRLTPGDQLSLKVTSRRFAEIAITKLGLLADAAPGSPARFDILAGEEGRYYVERKPRTRLAVLKVREPEPAGG